MTIKISTGLREMIAGPLGYQGALNRGIIKVFSGSQPANADAAETGTLLGTISKSHAAVTRETRATATLQVTGSSGTLTAVKVGTLPIIDQPGDVVWTTDVNTTAALICAAINRSGMAEATVSTDTVTVKPRPGFGDGWNGLALSSTGITCTGTSFASGVDPANGLVLEVDAVNGRVQKPSADDWSFVGLAAGTAGYWRFYPSDTADTGGAISGAPYYPRMDGICGVGSGDMSLSTLSVVIGGPVTVDRFRVTMPAN